MKTYYRTYYSAQFDGSTEPIAFVVVTDDEKTNVAFPLGTREDVIEGYLEAIAARINAIKAAEKTEKPLAIEILDIISYNMTINHYTENDESYSNFEDAVNDAKQYLQEDFPAGEYPKFYDPMKEFKPITAAADECPPATQDISINLANREKAIKDAAYGPLNPAEPNEEFWQEKSTRWSITPDEAKKSLCGNCVMFITTTKMKDCIAQGIEQGGSSEDNAWDAVDAAELGYCEAFDFKCAASRTCNAWVAGGPIDDSKAKE